MWHHSIEQNSESTLQSTEGKKQRMENKLLDSNTTITQISNNKDIYLKAKHNSKLHRILSQSPTPTKKASRQSLLDCPTDTHAQQFQHNDSRQCLLDVFLWKLRGHLKIKVTVTMGWLLQIQIERW